MRTVFLLLLFCSTYTAAESQDWCHQGAKWSYTAVFWGQINSILQYTYNKDTFLSNHNCHQLIDTTYDVRYQSFSSYLLDTIVMGKAIYTYSNADTVYFFDYNQNRWNAKYFFNVHIRDTIRISDYTFYGFDTVVTALMDTSGTMLIDTNHLRFYSFHLLDSCNSGPSSATVVERIGILGNSMDPVWECSTDPTYWNLCSYQDDSFIAYPSAGCPALVTGINEIKTMSFSVQPNPAQDEVTITVDPNIVGASLSISDMDGRNMHKVQLNSTVNKISTSDLVEGLYFLTIIKDGQQAISRKLVIEH